jgi:protein SCO1
MLLSPTFVLGDTPEEIEMRTQLVTKLGDKIILDTEVISENNQVFKLKELLSNKQPLIITPVYYTCPRLCGLTLEAVATLVKSLDLKIGKDYRILTVSFDVTESYKVAKQKGNHYRLLSNLSKKQEDSWLFAVADKKNIDRLMSDIGYRYRQANGEYSHTSAIFLITQDGVISQYFTGIEFPQWSVKLALIEASKGKIGELIDHVMLFCFKFDPLKGRYTLAAWNFVRAGSILCIGIFFITIFLNVRKRAQKF